MLRLSDRSLRWRLVGSHLATVFISIVSVSLMLVAVLLVLNWHAKPLRVEPATEAMTVAVTVQDLGWSTPDHVADLSSLLKAYQQGRIVPNVSQDNIWVEATFGSAFLNVHAISFVDPSGVITASSDPALVGRPVSSLPPGKRMVAERALVGDDDPRHLSTPVDDPDDEVAGASPVWLEHADGTRQVGGAILEDKTRRSFPSTDLAFTSLAARYALVVGTVLIVAVGIPAIIVALFIGINRARSIGRPINDLARAAERLASGDLSVRVWVPTDDEIARLARAFNRMGDQLQRSMEQEADARTRAEKLLATNRDLVANVSHELRTPVALIRGHIEALADDPSRLDAYATIALRESDRLEDLVNDLFQLARIDAQGMQLEHEPFDAAAAVREAIESLAEPARRDAGITMRAEIPAGLGPQVVIGDRARLVQVLQNLLRNAVRYTPEGGIILAAVEARPDDRELIIRVQDTGVGIAPDDLERIFDRFFRSDQQESRKGGGAGLGLFIAKQSVEAMGGTISVESLIGEGTTVTIVLPLAVPATTMRRAGSVTRV